jgi:glycolate oxidase
MQQLRAAFDAAGRCNPGKIFPTPGACVEVTRPRHRQVAL